MTIEEIAEVCHNQNRSLCQLAGDRSQKPWHEAEEWQRQSAINGVRFRIANPNATAAAQHEAWMAEKIKDGWKYAPTKSVEKKLHPCLVKFEDLPKYQQEKDVLFMTTVDSLKKFLSPA